MVTSVRGGGLPSGTVTFLMTDIEGSTRRWEADEEAMRTALATHDDLLSDVIDGAGGTIFKHTGDGICAAFSSADMAIRAAVTAQRLLSLPVRMGLATGDIEATGVDYFGPVLNRTARVMSAAHGGQILVADSAAGLLSGVELLDLGACRLRDLPDPVRIFQVCGADLDSEFPPLRTADIPGNLPSFATSFIGRDAEIDELLPLIDAERLVTLTGVGGVGKTRLSVQLADRLKVLFPDGVWLVELAPIGDPGAVADTVAGTLSITQRPGTGMAESIGLALADRTALIVLDNCEHVLGAAAELTATLLRHAEELHIVATSRESLGIDGEHVWPVPPLDRRAGLDSPAVALFLERAGASRSRFELADPGEAGAVVEICERLDGVALAIELAAARMVSMSPIEVRDRLDDRFRLLSGRRGLDRHQTLGQAVRWSYDLLSHDEQQALQFCSVFADGFDLAALCAVSGIDDEYAVLDLLDSLVRKSLVTTEHTLGHTRYDLLETIRQFAAERLVEQDLLDAARDRHADHFAELTLSHWSTWDGPQQRAGLDWCDVEFANLRSAFRWSQDTGDLDRAAAVAAHTAIMVWPLQRFEPVGWAEEILDAAAAVPIRWLPRLYVAAALCLYSGRPDVGVTYAERATALATDERFDPFVDGWSEMLEALAHLFGGRLDRRVEICTGMADRSGFARVVGLCGLTWALPAVGREQEATVIAADTLATARAYGSPFWIGWALGGYGRAYASTEPVKALAALREGLFYAREYRLPFWEANLAQDAARLEATHGDLDEAWALFDQAIDSFDRAGNVVFLAATLASLAVVFHEIGRIETAATIYGASTRQASISLVPRLAAMVADLRAALGDARFAECSDEGARMATSAAVREARRQIRLRQGEPKP